jgi:hypothetical protein
MIYRASLRLERGCRVTTAATKTDLMMMLLTGQSGIDLNAAVNELPCFRRLRIELTENGGGLNWSVQHYLEVYLPEFESPKFVAGVD